MIVSDDSWSKMVMMRELAMHDKEKVSDICDPNFYTYAHAIVNRLICS